MGARLFLPTGTGHEFADRFFGAFVLVEDGVHLFGDWHFDGVTSGETEGGSGAEDAFGDLSIEAGFVVGELASTA